MTPKSMAEDHVDWFLKAIRPLLIEHFIHGFKHGAEASEIINDPYLDKYRDKIETWVEEE